MAALLDEAITQIESQTPPMAPLPTIASLRQQLYKVDAATFLGQVTNRIDAMVDERIEQALTKRLGDAAEQFVAAKKKKAARKDAA